MQDPTPFKVIIVGGSIAGLTLAHCLDRAGIDYTVLEKHRDIHPELGAFIGILPNGARILDQLGLYSAVEPFAEPIRSSHFGFPDGFSYRDDYPEIINERNLCVTNGLRDGGMDRFGFPLAVLTRQQLLQVLYTSLTDGSRIRRQKKVVKIDSTQSGVSVQTDDGCVYQGDVVVGADGVHSVTRSEIWRIAGQQQPGLITEKEKTSMRAEFGCIFGISAPVTGIERGLQIVRVYDGVSFLIFSGKGGQLAWFLIYKLDKPYVYPDMAPISQAEADRMCESLAELPVWKQAKFGDIWKQRKKSSSIVLEENLFRTWHYGRIVCIGDSVSKMTPNFGQGANAAIEAAAALANSLRQLLVNTHPENMITNAAIEEMLEKFAQSQYRRAQPIHVSSRFLTRLQLRKGSVRILLWRYIAPLAGGAAANLISKTVAGGGTLDYIPVSTRGGDGWKSFQSSNRGTSLWRWVMFVVVIVFSLFWVRRR